MWLFVGVCHGIIRYRGNSTCNIAKGSETIWCGGFGGKKHKTEYDIFKALNQNISTQVDVNCEHKKIRKSTITTLTCTLLLAVLTLSSFQRCALTVAISVPKGAKWGQTWGLDVDKRHGPLVLLSDTFLKIIKHIGINILTYDIL